MELIDIFWSYNKFPTVYAIYVFTSDSQVKKNKI